MESETGDMFFGNGFASHHASGPSCLFSSNHPPPLMAFLPLKDVAVPPVLQIKSEDEKSEAPEMSPLEKVQLEQQERISLTVKKLKKENAVFLKGARGQAQDVLEKRAIEQHRIKAEIATRMRILSVGQSRTLSHAVQAMQQQVRSLSMQHLPNR